MTFWNNVNNSKRNQRPVVWEDKISKWISMISVENGCGPQDRREFPCSLHWWKGNGLQGIHLPPRDPQLHVPGWWLHQPQRNWRQVHLRQQVRRRELPTEAHRTWNLEHGQCWTQHQRIPIFPLHCQDFLVGWQTCCLWTSCRRHGCR